MADLGDTLNFRSDLYDKPAEQGGVLVNATTATLTITLPDGTSAAGVTIVNPPAITGKYLFDYVTTVAGLPGRYVGQWLFTLASGKTTSYVETFDVGSSLITVDEALDTLGAAGIITNAGDLEYLQWLCLAATDAVERDLNLVLVRRTITSTFDGGCYALRLKCPPRAGDGGSITITTVVENGATLSAGSYVLRKTGWRLYRGTSLSQTPWATGIENISVTYVAGCLDPPRIVRKVALNAVQRMWQLGRQASHPFLDDISPDDAVFSAAGSLTAAEQGAYESLKTPAYA